MKYTYLLVWYYEYAGVGYVYIASDQDYQVGKNNKYISFTIETEEALVGRDTVESDNSILWRNDYGNGKYEDGELFLMMKDGRWLRIELSDKNHAKIIATQLKR